MTRAEVAVVVRLCYVAVVSALMSSLPPLRRRSTRQTTESPSKYGIIDPTTAVTPSPLPFEKSNKRPRETPRKSKASRRTADTSSNATRTQSFLPLWSGTLDLHGFRCGQTNDIVQPHTLILGTHPSVTSLSVQQYYAHPMNAFWWIAGDCLGFRRDTGISPSTGLPYKFTSKLHPGLDVIPYQEQVRTLVQLGYCLWDVVESCVRPGSLDMDIQHEVPNDIRTFCQENPTIRRIVLANGKTASKMFVKHFRDWWESGELLAGDDAESQVAFGKIGKQQSPHFNNNNVITCICALSVSPAAAGRSYEEKRDFWKRYVYRSDLTIRSS